MQAVSRKWKWVARGVMITCLLLSACQEPISLAIGQASLDAEGTSENPSANLPKAEICGVLPLETSGVTSIDSYEDGAIVVGGFFQTDGQVVFGRGDPNETAIEATLDDGFVAKYNADRTLAWARAGLGIFERVEVIATTDGGVSLSLEQMVRAQSEPGQLSKLYADGDVVRLDANGDEEWTLDDVDETFEEPRVVKAAFNDDGSFVITDMFTGSITLGSGENEIALEAELDDTTFVAKYDAAQTLQWATVLTQSLVPNDIAIATDGAVAIVDMANTLVYLDAEGHEQFTIVSGHSDTTDPSKQSVSGSFIVWESPRVTFAPDDSIIWSGSFDISLVFSDDTGHEIELVAPNELTSYGGWGITLPFMARYSREAELLMASNSYGLQNASLGIENDVLAINPGISEELLESLNSSFSENLRFSDAHRGLVCDTETDYCANPFIAKLDMEDELLTIKEVDLSVPAWGDDTYDDRGARLFTLKDGSLAIFVHTVEGLLNQSFASTEYGGDAIVNICSF